jgi:hypothetical protein
LREKKESLQTVTRSGSTEMRLNEQQHKKLKDREKVTSTLFLGALFWGQPRTRNVKTIPTEGGLHR